MIIRAQEISLCEKNASAGYAQRFTDSTASIQLQLQALRLAEAQKSNADQAICYAYLAMTHRRLLHLQAFTQYAELSGQMAATTTDDRAKAFAAWAMGSLKSYIDDKSRALDYLLEAYGRFARLEAYDHCAKIGADISYLFSPGSEEKTKKYADAALGYATKSGDPENILHARLAVGSYLLDRATTGDPGQWPDAIAFFRQTIALAEQAEKKIISKSNLGIAYINLAVLYMNGPRPIDERSFLSCLEKATAIGQQFDIKNIYRSAVGLRGQYYLEKGEYDIAEHLFKEGIAYQQTLPYKDNYLQAAFYGCLKDLAARKKDYAAYYNYDIPFVRFNQLKYDESTQRILQNADARFESDKKITRIRQLEQENQLQRKNKLLGYGISAVLLAGLVFMYRSYYYRQRYYQNREDMLQQQQANDQLRMQLMEKETLENLADKLSLERRLLQSQMDPHFIFNALGNIQGMILQQDNQLALAYLSKFARLSRQVLEHSRMENITLAEEIATLTNYIELQQLRLNNSFDYHISCADDTDQQLRIPPLLIQPFLENAVEHGLKPLASSLRGLLTLHFAENTTDHLLVCTITDNGIGLTESRRRKTNHAHHSLATKITDERLQLMLKEHPHTRLEIREREVNTEGQGCVVIVYIPLS
ncbi:sensor histidine kinase [Chitinophaga nivalis]|uniref:Histidine kinase n=1 Tax=Chitinophaga nivalis TaxID=2991709 RepID=A0ABT3IJK1_9BACT|nr:histidine kinase [Chitinophaga nivalis]MCW3466172.1 histidine kinase [Chitinophaga nivalis]MCW3484137.1 histidine kinase [Chitinophaga nivalis]